MLGRRILLAVFFLSTGLLALFIPFVIFNKESKSTPAKTEALTAEVTAATAKVAAATTEVAEALATIDVAAAIQKTGQGEPTLLIPNRQCIYTSFILILMLPNM